MAKIDPATANQIVLFKTRCGQYPITRAERYKLAILHRLPRAEARLLAFGPRPPGGAPVSAAIAATTANTWTAARLAADYDARGEPRRPALGFGRAVAPVQAGGRL